MAHHFPATVEVRGHANSGMGRDVCALFSRYIHERRFPLSTETSKTTEKMASVEAVCINAPTGPKKTATLKHYPDAATTHAAHDGTETN